MWNFEYITDPGISVKHLRYMYNAFRKLRINIFLFDCLFVNSFAFQGNFLSRKKMLSIKIVILFMYTLSLNNYKKTKYTKHTETDPFFI